DPGDERHHSSGGVGCGAGGAVDQRAPDGVAVGGPRPGVKLEALFVNCLNYLARTRRAVKVVARPAMTSRTLPQNPGSRLRPAQLHELARATGASQSIRYSFCHAILDGLATAFIANGITRSRSTRATGPAALSLLVRCA